MDTKSINYSTFLLKRCTLISGGKKVPGSSPRVVQINTITTEKLSGRHHHEQTSLTVMPILVLTNLFIEKTGDQTSS